MRLTPTPITITLKNAQKLLNFSPICKWKYERVALFRLPDIFLATHEALEKPHINSLYI